MHPARAILRLQQPHDGNDDDNLHAMNAKPMNSRFLHESSSQDRLTSPSPSTSENQSPWRVRKSPRSDGSRSQKSYIEKPRGTLKETIDRRSCVNDAIESAIRNTPTPSPDRRKNFYDQQQKLYGGLGATSLREAMGWKSPDHGGSYVVSNTTNDTTGNKSPTKRQDSTRSAATQESNTSINPTKSQDSTRTAVTQESSVSTITSIGSKEYCSPYSPHVSSFKQSRSPATESSAFSQRQNQTPRRTRSDNTNRQSIISTDINNVTPINNKSFIPTPPRSQSSNSRSPSLKSSMKKSIDDSPATTCLVLSEQTPMTPQGKTAKPKIFPVDVHPWLKKPDKDGDGSTSKTLQTPTRTPQPRIQSSHRHDRTCAETQRKYHNNADRNPTISYSPDSINRTIEEQRALAKEMAEQLSKLPDTPTTAEQRRNQSWVAAERENILHHTHDGPRRTASLGTLSSAHHERSRVLGHRANSVHSFVSKKVDFTGTVTGLNSRLRARCRSFSPSTVSTKSGDHHRDDQGTNLSNHSGRSSSNHSGSHSASNAISRRSGKRPSSSHTSKDSLERALHKIGGRHDPTSTSDHRTNVSNHSPKENLTDGKSSRIPREEVDTKERRKQLQASKYAALSRRRMQRRQQQQQQPSSPSPTGERHNHEGPRHRSHSPSRNIQPPIRRRSFSKPDEPDGNRSVRRRRTVGELPTSSSPVSSSRKETSPTELSSPPRLTSPTSSPKNLHHRQTPSKVMAKEQQDAKVQCSFQGANQELNLNDWKSSSSSSSSSLSLQSIGSESLLSEDSGRYRSTQVHAGRKDIGSPDSPPATLAIEALPTKTTSTNNNDRVVEVTRPEKSWMSLSSGSNNNNSNSSLDHILNHMKVLEDLEKLSTVKTMEHLKRQRQLRLQAREHLLQLIENKMSVEEFQTYYHLTERDMKSLTSHVKICLQMKEEIRWDLVFHILLSLENHIGR